MEQIVAAAHRLLNCDRVVEFELAAELEIRGMFDAFYGTTALDTPLLRPGTRISPAAVQASMLRFPNDPAGAVQSLVP